MNVVVRDLQADLKAEPVPQDYFSVETIIKLLSEHKGKRVRFHIQSHQDLTVASIYSEDREFVEIDIVPA